MGCGGSSAKEQPAQEQQKEEKPVGLTQAEKDAIAVRGLKDALTWACDGAITLAKAEDTWKEDELTIKVPASAMDKINSLKEKISKVPLVGGTLAEGLAKTTEPFEEQFRSAGMAVACDDRTAQTYSAIVQSIETKDAISLCRSGGVTACVDYLSEWAKAALTDAMTPIVNSVMESHPLTKTWMLAIEAYNSAADKLSGIEPIEFDLNQYVLTETLASIKKLLMRKEKEIRAAPAQAVSVYVQQAFGQDPSQWKKQ